MPRYTKEQLNSIARSLGEAGYVGMALTVRWWHINCRLTRCMYPVMTRPLKDMPLFVNDENGCTSIIATQRLKFKRDWHYTQGGDPFVLPNDGQE